MQQENQSESNHPSPAELRLALPWARDLAKKIRQLKGMGAKQCERIMVGMVDGMALRTVEYPGNKNLPGIRPAFDAAYEQGYNVGESFAYAATVMQPETNPTALDAALALVDFGPCRESDRPQDWAYIATTMSKYCKNDTEDINFAAARIIADEYRKNCKL